MKKLTKFYGGVDKELSVVVKLLRYVFRYILHYMIKRFMNDETNEKQGVYGA